MPPRWPVAVAAGFLVLLAGMPTLAATPDPSPSSGVPPDETRFLAWLDRALPTGAAPGSEITVGAFLADPSSRGSLSGTALRLRLSPASGSAQATTTNAIEDWRGHVVAAIIVPDGGVGDLVFLLPGSVCTASGCTPDDVEIPVAGVGPPLDVPLPQLSTAFVDAPIQIVEVGRPGTVGFSVRPRIEWPEPGLVLPDELWLQVRIPQGEPLADVMAVLDDRPTGHYSATVILPQVGDYVVQVATTPNAGREDLFSTGIRRITAEDPGAAGSAVPSPRPSGSGSGFGDARDGVPGWVLPVVAALAVVSLVLLVGGRARRR